MFKYSDYFDQNLMKAPYESSEEELSDYSQLIEMIFEDFIYMKLSDTGQGAYSRGVVITEITSLRRLISETRMDITIFSGSRL